MCHGEAHGKGYGERQPSEAQPTASVAAEAAHVHLQAGQKHDVVYAHLPEELERRITCQEVQTVLSDEHSGQYETNDVWHAQPPEHNRRQQYDEKHDEEDPRRVVDER